MFIRNLIALTLWSGNSFSGTLSLRYACTQTKEPTYKATHCILFITVSDKNNPIEKGQIKQIMCSHSKISHGYKKGMRSCLILRWKQNILGEKMKC